MTAHTRWKESGAIAVNYALGAAIIAGLVVASAGSVTTKAADALVCTFAPADLKSESLMDENAAPGPEKRLCKWHHGGTQGAGGNDTQIEFDQDPW